jgi:hypothetical protein
LKKINVSQSLAALANIGVLAGIVFLAIEVRQNTRAQDAATYQEISRDVRDIITAVPAEIRDKVRSGEEISSVERAIYGGFILQTMRAYESWWQQHEIGTLSDEVYQSYIGHIYYTLGDALSREIWRSKPVEFLPGFELYVDEYMADNPLSR